MNFKKIFLLFFLSINISVHAKELRGAWVAVVENINWPSRQGLTIQQQKTEFIRIVDSMQACKMNAIFVQVRPSGDVIYPSKIEPFTHYITGKQGADPGYDPLQFMIDESHKRRIEFHAWLNPFRASANALKLKASEKHTSKKHPEWVLHYGNQLWLDPGMPEVWNYIVEILEEIIIKYNVDGIHFDDYFYPYKVGGKDFPDDKSFAKWGEGMSKADWRRSNTDKVVEMVSKLIKNNKPKIQFGISPFGVWRNISKDSKGSNTRAGQTNYDDLHADILKWMQNKWIDYAAPQLYWECGNKLCDYNILTKWWSDNNSGIPLLAGLAAYRIGEKHIKWKDGNEIINQIKILRNTENFSGFILYNVTVILENRRGLNKLLREINE